MVQSGTTAPGQIVVRLADAVAGQRPRGRWTMRNSARRRSGSSAV